MTGVISAGSSFISVLLGRAARVVQISNWNIPPGVFYRRTQDTPWGIRKPEGAHHDADHRPSRSPRADPYDAGRRTLGPARPLDAGQREADGRPLGAGRGRTRPVRPARRVGPLRCRVAGRRL